MLWRRLNRRTFGLVTLAVAFVFCVYLYFDIHTQLRLTEERNQRLKALQNSMSTQLQVIYEHKSRLERAIQDEKESHHKTKEAKQDLEMKLSREKQELQNRIQNVNQKQRILQAQFEDLQKEMTKSEADYQLLKADHQRDIEEYREKLILQSQQCENDRKYLSAEVAEVKRSKREISQSLEKCQELLKESEVHNNDIRNQAEEEVNKPEKLRVNLSENFRQHIDRNPVASFKSVDDNDVPVAGILQRKLIQQQPGHQMDDKQAAPIQPEDDKLARVKLVALNQTMMQTNEEEVHPLQAIPPPAPLLGNPEQRAPGDGLVERDHLAWKRDAAVGANPAVIDAPDGIDQKQLDTNQRLDEEEDREDVGAKNGQNEGDQKEEDDYQYDKNADDDEEKNEDNRADDFPDIKAANRNLNKIQNPVYPDDVEVANH